MGGVKDERTTFRVEHLRITHLPKYPQRSMIFDKFESGSSVYTGYLKAKCDK